MDQDADSRMTRALLAWALLGLALGGLALGGFALGVALRLGGLDGAARLAWGAGVLPVLGALLAEIVGSLRRGEVGLDIVAALSMSAALLVARRWRRRRRWR